MENVKEFMKNQERVALMDDVHLMLFYSNRIKLGVYLGEAERISMSHKHSLEDLSNRMKKFISSMDGKDFDEQLKNAFEFCESRAKDDSYCSGKTNRLASALLSTNSIITKIDREIEYHNRIKSNFDNKNRLFPSVAKDHSYYGTSEPSVEISEYEKNEGQTKVLADTTFFDLNNKNRIVELKTKDDVIEIINRFKRLKNAFISERRRLFGPKSQFAAFGLFAD